MLWSEIGSSPQIEYSGMDGSKRKVVVNRSLSWPVSLAYDFVDDRVYWADEKLRCIGSTSLDGGDIKVTVSLFHLGKGWLNLTFEFTETFSFVTPDPPVGGNSESVLCGRLQ